MIYVLLENALFKDKDILYICSSKEKALEICNKCKRHYKIQEYSLDEVSNSVEIELTPTRYKLSTYSIERCVRKSTTDIGEVTREYLLEIAQIKKLSIRSDLSMSWQGKVLTEFGRDVYDARAIEWKL